MIDKERPHLRLQPSRAPNLYDKLLRLLWGVVEASLFRCSPVPMHAWRCFLLRLFGADVGKGAHPYPTARIWAPWNLSLGSNSCLGPRVICYSVAPITIESCAIVSQGAHLCAATHDHRNVAFPLVIGEIRIGEEAWVAADAFVSPGIHIGRRAVVGARAVVTKDVVDGVVVAGNPARQIGSR